MPTAIQTVAGFIANPGATFTAVTSSTGDSFNPANFNMATPGFIHSAIRGGATAGALRVISPRLHDAVRPLEFHTDLVQSRLVFPQNVGQPVYPADVFTVQLTGGTAETDVAVLTFFYQDMPGIQARLHMWGDISGIIRNLKTVLVAVTTNATIGQWQDTVITTTENFLKADTDYAVLGYATDAALTAIGVKGPDTGNLRIADTGTDFTEDTTNMFISNSMYHNLPWIPVIAANNRAGTFVSCVHNVASVAANVVLYLAELAQRVTP